MSRLSLFDGLSQEGPQGVEEKIVLVPLQRTDNSDILWAAGSAAGHCISTCA